MTGRLPSLHSSNPILHTCLTMLSDFRLAIRSLLRSPVLFAVSVLTLALALGVNTAMLSLLKEVIFHPVVPHQPEQVVALYTVSKDSNHAYRQFAYSEFQTLRESPETFPDLVAYCNNFAGIARGNETMHRGYVVEVSGNFFSFMGVRPLLGRFFTPEEGQPNAHLPVVVASYPFWQRMGGRPDFIGSTLRLNGNTHTVIGIAPQGFSGTNALMSPSSGPRLVSMPG